MILFDEKPATLDPLSLARCPGCGLPTVARLGWIHLNSSEALQNVPEVLEHILTTAETPMACTHCQITLDAVLEPGAPFFESAGPDPGTRRDRYLDHLYRADEEADCGGPDRCAWCAAEARP